MALRTNGIKKILIMPGDATGNFFMLIFEILSATVKRESICFTLVMRLTLFNKKKNSNIVIHVYVRKDFFHSTKAKGFAARFIHMIRCFFYRPYEFRVALGPLCKFGVLSNAVPSVADADVHIYRSCVGVNKLFRRTTLSLN